MFLKRDNGGVFNPPEVDAFLAQFAVNPLNSPTRYPRYHGAIEHGIGELKHDLHGCLPRPTPSGPSAIEFSRGLAPARSVGYAPWITPVTATCAALITERDWVHARKNTDIGRRRWSAAQLAELVKGFVTRRNVPIFNLEIHQEGALSPV